MEKIKVKKIPEQRESVGTFSDFSQNDDSDEIDDPISAYFKQRCGKYNKTYLKKHIESDSDSSVGLIDVDNVSLFDEGEDSENKNLRFSENILEQLKRESLKVGKNKKDSVASISLLAEVESELDKQRALAQKALQRLSIKTNESQNELLILSPEKSKSSVLSDISSKLLNMKLSIGKECKKEWFQPNFSPNTPRCFNDELSSFGGEDENFAKSEIQNNESESVSKSRQTQYAKKISSMLNDVPEIPDVDMEFVPQSKEEQINRFEEDEKKFKLENSGLLHNSQISQFSDGISQWPLDASNVEPKTGGKNLSIGQFFTLRSNRVSSLVGSVGDVTSIPPSAAEESQTSALTSIPSLQLSKSECSLPIGEVSQPEKPRFRRCVSTYDLKSTPGLVKSLRYSSDSSSSNSTLMIQDILAEMESGLSGTQIYEKLMKSYKRRENEGKFKKNEKKVPLKKILENGETPKSSKEPKRKEMVKSNKKLLNVSEECIKTKSSVDRNLAALKYKEKPVRDVKLKDVCSPRNDKVKKTSGSKGFFASTPKNQSVRSEIEKLKTESDKILIDNNEWEFPKVKSVLLIDLDRSETSEENEKTITVNSTTSSEHKKNNTIVDTFTIEDTIVAGDLTVISQRIDEMKRDSVCIVRSAEPEEPDLLTVIQKLADLPKGSLDCSALTPLLRDQFPELLSNFPTPSENSSITPSKPDLKLQNSLIALPGSWVKLPGILGLNEKICAFADLQRTILVPMVNVSQNWLLVSIEGLSLGQSQGKGKKLTGVKKGNEWSVMDFVIVSLKETIIPPENRQMLKVFFKSKVPIKFELTITFNIKELIDGETQTQNLRLLVHNVHPENYINVLPKDPINFGVIADNCFDQTNVQISFDGVSELPLTVYIEEDESVSTHFILKPCSGQKLDKGWDEHLYHHVFYEGEKQVLELRVVFLPNIILKEDSKTQDFRASLVIMLGGKTETDGVLKRIPIKGSVGYAKFLCSPSCSPLVFRTSGKDQPVTRPYPLKNIGSLPIAFCLTILDENHEPVEGEEIFVAPKSFYLSRNEEANINITFNANSDQNYIKRFLKLQMKPNARVVYETELIGIITSPERRPFSRTSASSVCTKSSVNSESGLIKLQTTTRSLSWPAVPLEKEVRQSFQIKSLSNVPVSLRITLDKNADAFKLVNENGEKVNKMRKVLKPDCPCALTVVFRPYVVSAFNTSLVFETSLSGQKKKILLNGIGGIPNLVMRNVKSDLNGCKILRLQHSHVSNQFESAIEFKNEGRIPAFLIIKIGVKDFSLSHDLKISPSSFVLHSESSITVKISQKLRHEDLQQLLSDKEICKIATISVITGDEPSRLRIRQLVEGERLELSERLKLFTGVFHDEKPLAVEKFIDSPGFELEFLKSLKLHEIAVVIERNSEIFEPSILEETTDEFVSFISYNTMISTVKSQKHTETECCSEPQKLTFLNPTEVDTTAFSTDSLKSAPSHNRVTKWLETLDCD